MSRGGDPQPPVSAEQLTELLQAWSGGDQGAFEKLAPLVYDELRRLARHYMARERRDHTLQPTALVHEVYMRLADYRSLQWQDRVHFFAMSARIMRQVLVDFARSRESRKRGRSYEQLNLDEYANFSESDDAQLLALDDALTALGSTDRRKCDVVEMKFFGGLTTEEIADALKISTATVQREWTMAKLWLFREMNAKEPR